MLASCLSLSPEKPHRQCRKFPPSPVTDMPLGSRGFLPKYLNLADLGFRSWLYCKRQSRQVSTLQRDLRVWGSRARANRVLCGWFLDVWRWLTAGDGTERRFWYHSLQLSLAVSIVKNLTENWDVLSMINHGKSISQIKFAYFVLEFSSPANAVLIGMTSPKRCGKTNRLPSYSCSLNSHSWWSLEMCLKLL